MEPVVVTYLEMCSRDELRPRSAEGLALERVDPPDPAFNARMYREVGAAYRWIDRLPWSIEDWRRWVERAELETHAIRLEGELAGYVELDARDGDVELAYFGLLPAFVGRSIGGAALSAAIERAWDRGASRVWVHTCTLDHPYALANYRARGMQPYREELGA